MSVSVRSCFSPVILALTVNLVLGGLVYYVLSSVLYNTCAPVPDPESHTFSSAAKKANCGPGEDVFKKPYFMNVYVYAALSVSIVVYMLQCHSENLKAKSSGLAPPSSSWTVRNVAIVSIPALFDSGSRLMAYIAASFIPASVVLLIKGTRIVWTAVLSVMILPEKKLFLYHWVAVMLASAGVLFVGYSELMNGFKGTSDVFMGLALSIGGEFIRAAHLVVVELIMKGRYSMAPLFVAGMKGVWGFSMMALVLALVTWGVTDSATGQPVEDLGATFYMIFHSWELEVILGSMFAVYFIVDVGGIFVTKYLSAVHNSLCSVLRGVFIWAVELSVYYGGATLYGEAWGPHSWAKVIGFVLVGVATFIFNGNLKVPFLYYPPDQEVGLRGKAEA